MRSWATRALLACALVYTVSCAPYTVYYDASTRSYSVKQVKDPKGVAYGDYTDRIQETGWGTLDITGNSAYPDDKQAYAAGFLEGYATWEQMDYYGINQFFEWGFTPATVPSKLLNFMAANLKYSVQYGKNQLTEEEKARQPTLSEWLRTPDQVQNAHDESVRALPEAEPFVHQGNYNAHVLLYMMQFEGMVDGYRAAHPKGSSPGLSRLSIWMLNCAGDMEDLVPVLTAQDSRVAEGAWPIPGVPGGVMRQGPHMIRRNQHVRSLVSGKTASGVSSNFPPYYHEDSMTDCSALVRVFPGKDGKLDVAMAHITWRSFMLMNRIQKNVMIYGTQVKYSSSPNFLSSKDDFYVSHTQSGRVLAVYETTNSIFNQSLYDEFLTPSSLMVAVRVMVANRMAANGSDWANTFKRENSGTYNNQFGVVDMTLFDTVAPKTQSALPNGLFYIIEQTPGYTHQGDVTATLRSQGFWPSYNIPYFKDIYKRMGYPSKGNDPKWSYSECPRAQIFAREAPKTSSFADVQNLIRFNQWESDPKSLGDPANSVASRYDLRSGSLASKAAPFGGVDGKVTSHGTLFSKGQSSLYASVIAGPTHENKDTPVFQWGPWQKYSHAGQPAAFNFDWIDA